MRIAATVWLPLCLALGACGGDVSSSPSLLDQDASRPSGMDAGSSSMLDAGLDAATGGRDAHVEHDGALANDASTALVLDGGDAGSAALAAALGSAGSNGSIERARLVIQALCDRAAQCQAPAEPDPDCNPGRLMEIQGQLDDGYSVTCLDATLDFFGCNTLLPTCQAFALGCPNEF